MNAKELPAALRHMHDETRSWRLVGMAIGGYSGAYARQVARGIRQVSPGMIVAFATYERGMDVVPIPALPCPSCGQLHQVDDCHNQAGTVALIPAGSRIIPPSPRKRAPYRRPTWAMVRAMQAEIDDWHASMQAALDPCADEQHCACVPYLRRRIADLEAQLEAQHDPHP